MVIKDQPKATPSQTPAQSQASQQTADATVKIRNFKFEPANLLNQRNTNATQKI